MAQVNYAETLAADGETTAQTCIGPVRLSLTGDFGSGTAVLQARIPNGEYVAVTGGSFTAATDTIFNFTTESKNDLRVSLSGATAPDLVAWLQAD